MKNKGYAVCEKKFDSTRTHESFNTAAPNLAQNIRSFSEVESLREGTTSITHFHVYDVTLQQRTDRRF